MEQVPGPNFYFQLANWWPLFAPVSDYEEEAACFTRLLTAGDGPAQTLLELGSGGGNNAFFLKRRFAMTLTDVAAGMLDVSRALNAECEQVEGDMRTLRLGRQFDRVFVHDAIAYMTSEDDLRRAIETAQVHCRAGGLAIFAPDYLKETFTPLTDHGGSDGNDGRGLRYLEWVVDPDPSDSTYLVDYAFLLREPDGVTRAVHERHVEGLFSRKCWLTLLDEAGFDARAASFEHSELEPGSHEIFVCTKR
jgi:SAM-dependent methyltransferase